MQCNECTRDLISSLPHQFATEHCFRTLLNLAGNDSWPKACDFRLQYASDVSHGTSLASLLTVYAK